MEKLQFWLILWGTIGIIVCTGVLYYLNWLKKHNPNFLTDKATPQDALKAQKIIIGFLSSFIIYIMLFMFVLVYISYDELPYSMYIPGAVFIIGALVMMVSAFKKNSQQRKK